MATGRKKRKGMTLILLALILIFGLAAVLLLLRNRLFSNDSGTENGANIEATPAAIVQNTVNIVVLGQPVTRGTEITEAVLTMVPYPADRLVAGLFFTNMEDVLGKKAKFDLEFGIPLTPNLLTSDTDGSMVSFDIPRGLVAISLPINRLSAVSYALVPGDHVNVIASLLLVTLDEEFQTKLPNWTANVLSPYNPLDFTGEGQMPPVPGQLTMSVNGSTPEQGRAILEPGLEEPMYIIPSEPQRPRLVSQTIVQDAAVLWVGDYPLQDQAAEQQPAMTPTPAPGVTPSPEPTIKEPEVITLVVTPQDAITLNYLMLTDAQFTLAMRSAGDAERITTEAVTLQFIMEQYNIPLPEKLPYGIEPAVTELSDPDENEPIIIPPAQ